MGSEGGRGAQARAGAQAGKRCGEGRRRVGGVRRVPGNGLEEARPKAGARKMGPVEGRADLGTLQHYYVCQGFTMCVVPAHYGLCKLKMKWVVPFPLSQGPVADARARLLDAQKPVSPPSPRPPSFKDVEL